MIASKKDCYEKSEKVLNKKDKFVKYNVLVILLASLVPIALPSVHMLVFDALWGQLKDPVNKTECSCSCWDTKFKGMYEYDDTHYKHVYFNSTSNTFKMWTSTVIMILFLYSSFQRFFTLLFANRIRWIMGVLFLANLHNQYYAWWSFWNYWNDDFYTMWSHELIYAITEGISIIMILISLDRTDEIQPFCVLTITVIAIFHVIASSSDQFVDNVISGYGELDQILRDLLFMAADLLICALSLYELHTYAVHKKGVSLLRFLLHRPILIFSATLLTSLFLIFNFIS